MLEIVATDLGKKYNKEWIFRQLTMSFVAGNKYAVIGNNGSGKSTLLQCLTGATTINTGTAVWQNDAVIPAEKVFQYFSLAAPYLDIIEEMTAKEFLLFHAQFKPFIADLQIKDILEEVQLTKAADKQIRYFSSGMKQRVKLAQCFFSDVPVLLLDEPCTNLDKQGIDLYLRLMDNYTKGKLVLVSSNDPVEHDFCDFKINMLDYKQQKATI